MTGLEERIDGAASAGSETTLRFVLTLIVTTLMVAMTAYVLSYAVLAPGATAARGAAASMQHARS